MGALSYAFKATKLAAYHESLRWQELSRIRTMHRDVQRFAKKYTLDCQGEEEGEIRFVHMDDPGHERGVEYRDNESVAPGTAALKLFDGR